MKDYMLTCGYEDKKIPYLTLIISYAEEIEGGIVYEVKDLPALVRELISGLEEPNVSWVQVDCLDDIIIPINIPVLSEDSITTKTHWDCECEQNYIHPKYDPVCSACGAMCFHQPDSDYEEVIEKLKKL